jgi:hypothetical protein
MMQSRTVSPTLRLSFVVFMFMLVSTSAAEAANPTPLTTTGSAYNSGQESARLSQKAENLLKMAIEGNLTARMNYSDNTVNFLTATSYRAIRFGKRTAFDTNHKPSKAASDLTSARLAIRVDVADAVRPITIDPLATSPTWTVESDQAYASFGRSVAMAGDVNGDGYGDVIVGAYAHDNGETDEGRAYLYLGSASGLSLAPDWTAESDQIGAAFGCSVASAGDVDGDGYGDVIVGAYAYDDGETDEGRAYLYLGSASGLSLAPDWTAEGDQADAYFGCSVASAGDVNGDGYGDVIVGAYLYDNSETDEGRAYLYLGSATGLSTAPDWTAESNQANASFGRSVALAGDVNGDGYGDVIVGAQDYSNIEAYEGRAYLYIGSASGLSTAPDWTAESDQTGAYFGCSVASAGDVNGDGYGDVIVGAHHYSNTETHEGRACLYLGSASGLATAPDWTAVSAKGTANFGHSVASAGDVNGDGYGDVVVGAPGGVLNPSRPLWVDGRSYLYLGSASGLSTAPDWATESFQRLTYFGWSVASAGDVNGDGYGDIIIGAPNYDNPETDEGRTFVYTYSSGP